MMLQDTSKLQFRQISAISSSSWCTEPLEETCFSNQNISRMFSSTRMRGENDKNYPSSGNSERSSSSQTNKEFIKTRIRNLVDAFSNRARETKESIEMPATPSSISSRETIVQSQSTSKLVGKSRDEEKGLTDASLEDLQRIKRNVWVNIAKRFERSVIDPQGKVYVIWMSFACAAVLYNAWVIPLRSTFPYQDKNNRAVWMFFDYVMDFIYLLDVILIQPRIMFLNEGFWMNDIIFTKQNYISSVYFKLDILALTPLDLFYFWVGPEHVILRFPRFFKLHTFWDYFNHVDKKISNPHIIRIVRTLLYMMYLIHLNACAYYAFSSWEGIGSNIFVFNGKGNAYVRCFYFATKTATSIGKNPKPTQEIEYMFMTFSWLMGVFVFALLIGQIRDIFATASRSQTEYKKLVDETVEYVRRLNLSQDLQKRIKLWFNYTWDTQHTLDENSIMDCLPHKMKTDIAINVHIDLLSKVSLFAECDEGVLRELVTQLKSVIYLPNDIICRKGDVGKEMYIIKSGKVLVMGSKVNEILATLCEGSVFGEISLLGIPGMSRRTADVKSQGYSNLFVLSKTDLNAALSQFPEAQQLLNKKAKILMKKNAQVEKKLNPQIVINNPKPVVPHARLLDTVMQVVAPDSKANKFLRYGSKGKLKKGKRLPPDQIRSVSLEVENMEKLSKPNKSDETNETLQTAQVIVHRAMD